MTDPVKDPAVQDQKVTPEPTGDPAEGDKKFELPEHLKGKTPEELAQMVMEKESAFGRQSTEVGELRKELQKSQDDLNYMRGVEELRRHQEAKRKAEEDANKREPAADRPKWNYDDPMQSVDERIDQRVKKEKDDASQARFQEHVNLARGAFAEGQKCMEEDKELFEGIEDDVRKAVFQYYVPYLQQGYDISGQLRDPKAWRVAAQNIRLGRGEVDKIKASESNTKISPMSPTAQEIPGSPSGQTAPTGELDPEVKKIADQYGFSYEEAQEIIQEEAKVRGVR